MKVLLAISIFGLLLFAACGGAATGNTPVPTPGPSKPMDGVPTRAVDSPLPTPNIPKDGDYPARGKVTRINVKNGSIELDHEDIPGVMPAMRMEFNVKDKAQLSGLTVGDTVDFVLQYKHPTETIISIKKAK